MLPLARPMALLALSFLVASGILAGCLREGADDEPAPPLDPAALVSQPVWEASVREHLPVAAADGTLLDAWVWRPEPNGTETFPVVINFSPYWSNLAPPAATGGDAFSLYLIDYYVPRGYAVALVSARGTGESEGCFTIGGPTEIADESAVVDLLAAQPWSNGNASATGKSYDGTMAQGLATTGNPHVKTIVPVAPISELYKYNYFYGVPYRVTGQAFNAYYVAQVSLAQSDDPSSGTWARTPTRFCDESAEVQAHQVVSMASGDYTSYWQARNYSALLPDAVPSVFYIHGLGDWNVKPDHMVPWIDELRSRGAPVKMWLGQWAHDYPTRDDWNLTMLRWHDHFLKGIDTGILAEPLVQVQDSEGVWRHEDLWPPATVERRGLYPSGEGALLAEPGSGASTYQDSPAPALSAPAPGGPATFRSAPLAEDLRLAGEPLFHAEVSATGPRATMSVTLRLDGKVIDQGFLDLAHRDRMEASDPMVPGERYDVTVRFYPQDVLLPKGSVLSVTVDHDGDGGPVTVVPMATGALVTLHHGKATMLSLPVVPAANVTPEEPQPVDVGCWAC